MTTAPIDPAVALGPRTKAPPAVVGLTLASAAVMAGHLLLSVAARHGSVVWSAFPAVVWTLHVAGILAAVALGVWTWVGLTSSRSEPARPAAALARYAVLAGIVALICSWTLEATLVAAPAAQWGLRLVRAAVAVGLPVYALSLLGRHPGSRAAYGPNVGARAGDFLLANLARDGAAAVLLMVVLLVSVLFARALPSMKVFGLGFLVTSEWRANELPGEILRDAAGNPRIEDGEVLRGDPVPPKFGALPVIYGTAVSSAIALLVAVPLSFGAALFLVRISQDLRPITVKAGVAGLLIVLLLPMAAAKWSVAGGGGKVSVPLVLLAAVVGIGVAELLLWLANRMLAGLTVGQAVPRAYDGLAHLLLFGLATWFGAAYLGLGATAGRPAALLFGAAASAALFPVAAYFMAAVSFLIEFLAAVPSIAYGLWGMQVLAVFLQADLEPLLISGLRGFGVGVTANPIGRDMLNGGLILGIMTVPIVTAISRDVLRAVPGAQVEGTTALGATWWQSSAEMLKFSRSALFGAVMLGLARAAGETMAVTMVIGNNPQIVGLTADGPVSRFMPNVFGPAQTMASLLANEFGEASGLHFSALMYVAFVLLAMSLAFNVVARYFVVGKGARTAAAH
ncbi:MAG: phosphate transporter permease [Phycisphaerales bacterium]|nr:phosphate transporter permease [Phycisphaerales bacterium]